jgi:hypothetical protein
VGATTDGNKAPSFYLRRKRGNSTFLCAMLHGSLFVRASRAVLPSILCTVRGYYRCVIPLVVVAGSIDRVAYPPLVT